MRVGEISLKQLQKMGLHELNSLYSFLEDPSEEAWRAMDVARLIDERWKLKMGNVERDKWPEIFKPVDWLIGARENMGRPPMSKDSLTHYIDLEVRPELFTQREILKTKGIDESLWDERLRGEDWESRLYLSYGLSPRETSPPPKNIESPVKDKAQVFEPRTKPKPPKRDDPFRSDGFGTLLK